MDRMYNDVISSSACLLQLVSKSTVLLRPSDTRDMQYINGKYDQRIEDDFLQLDSVAVPEGAILFTRSVTVCLHNTPHNAPYTPMEYGLPEHRRSTADERFRLGLGLGG